MEMRKHLRVPLLALLLWGGVQALQAQSKTAADKTDIEYESQFDDPYDINKMWLHFYPFYADAFVTNFNVGFGAQVNYLYKNKFDFHAHARTTYARFSDFAKLNGDQNTITTNRLNGYRYFEGGATYHFKDEAVSGESKIVVYTNRYSDRKWASTVPEYIKIPTKVRKIIGIRAGGYYWGAATNLGEALERQNLNLIGTAGDTLGNSKLYTNIQSAGVFLGGKISRMRNVVVKPKKYDVVSNDMIFSAYADMLYAPLLQIEEVAIGKAMYSTTQVKLRRLGFRAGMEAMFNRDFSWTYGAEMGYRPSMQTRGFYASMRVGFSFASRMQQKRQAYQVERKSK